MKKKSTMTVVSNSQIAAGIRDLTVRYEQGNVETVAPGQFANLFTKDPSALLPRPISICGWDEEKRTIRFVFRTVGKGTKEFAGLQPGETIDVLGILGNGYDLSLLEGRDVLLMGGGIGAPPLLELAKRIKEADDRIGKGSVTAVLGYRTNDLFLKDEFEQYARVIIATDDGTAGTKGTVLDAAAAADVAFDIVCSCGPMPMLRGVKKYAAEKNRPAFISLEERMACGVGACLGCVTKTVRKDAHSHVNNARICVEGPVFNAEDVEI